jgi:hypothetical protein
MSLSDGSPLPATQAAAKTTPTLVIKPPFRVSETTIPDRGATFPDLAFNPDDNEYLVVWESDGLTEVKGVKDIYGERLNAATNDRIGIAFRISTLTDRDKNHGSNRPRIVYNRTAHEYLVIWYGSGLFDSPDRFFEVYGQRLDRTGKQLGTNFRISYATDLGKVSTSFVRSSSQADLSWNSTNNEYLVIWKGMGEPEDVVKMEIYGQRLTSKGESLGKSFRISHTSDQGVNFPVNAPAIAYNGKDNQYLVVWSGGFKTESQLEVLGTGLSAAGLVLGQKSDFRISQMVEAGSDRRASFPRTAYNEVKNEYLVVFQGTNEIDGQRIDAATLSETGPNDFRVSKGSSSSSRPAVSFNSVMKEYLVIWRSVRENTMYEVSGKRISSDGAEVQSEVQISNIGAVGKDRTLNNPSVTSNAQNGEHFVVWQGNALPAANAAKVIEIFGQKLVPVR